MCIACSVAELASAAPTAGGLYYWTFQYTSPRWRYLLSWVVGCKFIYYDRTLFLAHCVVRRLKHSHLCCVNDRHSLGLCCVRHGRSEHRVRFCVQAYYGEDFVSQIIIASAYRVLHCVSFSGVFIAVLACQLIMSTLPSSTVAHLTRVYIALNVL